MCTHVCGRTKRKSSYCKKKYITFVLQNCFSRDVSASPCQSSGKLWQLASTPSRCWCSSTAASTGEEVTEMLELLSGESWPCAAMAGSQNQCPTDDERLFHVNRVDILKQNKLAIYTWKSHFSGVKSSPLKLRLDRYLAIWPIQIQPLCFVLCYNLQLPFSWTLFSLGSWFTWSQIWLQNQHFETRKYQTWGFPRILHSAMLHSCLSPFSHSQTEHKVS